MQDEQTFLVPRKVKTEFQFLGMHRRHLLLVAPWAAAAALIYYLGGSVLPPLLHLGTPVALGLFGYTLFGWAVGEDDHTLWELARRWWQHKTRPHVYVYGKEGRTCGHSGSKVSPAASGVSYSPCPPLSDASLLGPASTSRVGSPASNSGPAPAKNAG